MPAADPCGDCEWEYPWSLDDVLIQVLAATDHQAEVRVKKAAA
jgi:hypothetical protein